MPVNPGKKYKEYNEIDFGDVDPISLEDFVSSMVNFQGQQSPALMEVMSENAPLPTPATDSPQPVVSQEDIISKIKALEPEFTRKPIPRKPTSIMDVVGSISQAIGGGRETPQGGKDFLGGVMDVLDRIGGYASSGQGTSLLGAVTGNRGMIESGLRKLAEEGSYQQQNQEDQLTSAQNALNYYKSLGDVSGSANKGQYLTPKAYFDPISGKYKLGAFDTTATDASKAFIKSPNDVEVGPEQSINGINPYTGLPYYYGKMTGDNKNLIPEEGAFNPKETEDLTQRSNSLISSQAKTLDTLGAIRNARGLVNSTHGLVSLQNMLSTAAGDPGNKSVADREGITGPNAFLAKIKNYYSMSVGGKLPPEGQEYIQDLLSKYEQAAINKIESEIEINKQAFLSLYPNANKEEVDKHFRRIIAKQISDSTPKAKSNTSNKKSGGKPPKSSGKPQPPKNKKDSNSKSGAQSNTFTSNKGKTYTLKDPRTK